MVILFVRHEVADYAAWRRAYDAFADVQKANGVVAEAVYQAADNPNDVTVTHEFATLDAAQAFGALEELRSTMRTGGVLGTPTVWLVNKA